jgi:hypothetical protein
MAQKIRKRLDQAGWESGHLHLNEFDTYQGTAGEESVVAEFRVDRPIILREDRPVSLVVPAYETFTVDGSADNSETFSLSNNLLDSPASENLVLWDDGSRVQPDSIDYANDSFDYTSPNTGTTLDVYYIPRNPAEATLKKVGPGAGGGINQELHDWPLALAHTRDQHEDPIEMDMNRTPLQPVVPRKWKVQVVVDAPYTVGYAEDSRGTHADNALLSLPRVKTEDKIEGLASAVKRDIARI